jgi:16S rRNA processing protein RimM
MDDLVAVAKIVRPRGLRGEAIAEVLTDFPERFEKLEAVTAVMPDGERRELKLENAWFQKERIVLKFEGLDSVDDAEAMRDAEICISEQDAVELEEGEFFDWQLEGCETVTPEGEPIGKVREVMRTGGTELLVVDAPDGRELLIPFAEAICTEVDLDAKRITVDPPEGLLEF